MGKIRKRLFVSGILLIIIAAISLKLRYNVNGTEGSNKSYINTIPYKIGEWKGYDLNLDKKVYEILETKDIVQRSYINDSGKMILLSIVHYKDTKVDFHSPESCLGGLGENVSKKIKKFNYIKNGKNGTIEIAELLSFDQKRRLISYYLYQTGYFFSQNYIYTRLNIAYNKLFKDNASASLVRITTNADFNDDHNTRKMLDSFLTILLGIIQTSKLC